MISKPWLQLCPWLAVSVYWILCVYSRGLDSLKSQLDSFRILPLSFHSTTAALSFVETLVVETEAAAGKNIEKIPLMK